MDPDREELALHPTQGGAPLSGLGTCVVSAEAESPGSRQNPGFLAAAALPTFRPSVQGLFPSGVTANPKVPQLPSNQETP